MSCCRDAYTAGQHRLLERAQQEYDNELPADPEEVEEQEARRRVRDQQIIDEWESTRGGGG